MRGWPLALPLVLVAVSASAARFSEKQLAQQQRMKDCVAEAKTQGLRGEARMGFLKTCLAGGEVTVEPLEVLEPSPSSAPLPVMLPPAADR